MSEDGTSAGRSAFADDGAEAGYDVFARASHWRSLAVALVKASRDCVKLISLEGLVEATNPAGIALLQFDEPGQLIGRVWVDLWQEPERGLVADAVARGCAGQPTSFQGFCPTAKGEPRWWEVQVAPVFDEEGFVRCLLATSRDVTSQREREQEMEGALKRQRQALLTLSADFEENSRRLRDAEARASHDDRLRMFGRFVGGVVHDFNNVFAAVHGAARLLRRRVTDGPALDVVNHVERAAERGATLARQLLDFARGDADQAEVFEPGALLTRDSHLLRHIVSSDAQLVVEAQPDVWRVLGSPQRFQSVLFNLVANARDAIPARGRIEVRLANAPAQAREGLEPGDYVLLTVSDDGCGMAPEVVARAGEPFFTTKAAGKGTGLGLASAFELAANCGGHAFVASEEGKGTVVSVYLRRSPIEGETAMQAGVDPALHGGAKLLLVEDEPLTRDHLAQVFRDLNYVVVEASAFEIAAATAEGEGDFDLVIADLNLKDGLGDRLVAQLRQKRPALPAIFVTGSAGLEIPRDETVLTKPVSEAKLARTVLEKLGRLPGPAASSEALAEAGRIAPRIHDAGMKAALDAWRQYLETRRRIPGLADPGPWREEPPPLGYVVAVGAGANPELRFVSVGAELSARLGRPLQGAELSAGDEQTLGNIARALRRRLNGTPGYGAARFTRADGSGSLAERLLLPLDDSEGRVGHLFGLIAFSEG